MGEINDDQLLRIPTLVSAGSGTQGAGVTSVLYQAATTLHWVVAVKLTTPAGVYVSEQANVAGNLGLAWQIKHFADGTTGLVLTNNSAGTLGYSFKILGYG
jgi:hypothetical protein